MADSNADEILRHADHRFSKKAGLDSLWQRIAEEIYPERADFTVVRNDGDEFAEHLYESTPAQNRRELAYAMGALMRPPAKKWFRMKPREKERQTHRAMVKLGECSDEIRNIIYAGSSRWQASLQEGDDDVIAFGNAVHSVVESSARDGAIIYETHHLRDCAWAEDRHRNVNYLARKVKVELRNWEAMFPGVTLEEKLKKTREKDPFHETDIVHAVMPAEQYESYRKQRKGAREKPFASVYVCRESRRIVKEGGYHEFPYVVRRWKLRSGSPYAYSPSAMLGLIDARVLQAQSRVILDAGEFSVRPPMIARDEVLGEVALHAGAINTVSSEYDERLGEAIRPIEMGQNLPLGLEMKQDTRLILAAAFFLNKLTLPSDKEMTAYEVGERISEYIRSIGPVVEPFEQDNTQLLDQTFQIGLRLGRFGPPGSFPPELIEADLSYDFDTPIQIAYARQKVLRAKETVGMLGETVQATGRTDLVENFDLDKLVRDGAISIDGEADWLVPAEVVADGRQARAEAMQRAQARQETAETVQNLDGMADVGGKAVGLGQQLGMLPGPDDARGQVIDAEFQEQQDGYPEAVDWPDVPDEDGGESIAALIGAG